MSFMYPRVVAFTRPGAQTGVGAVGYGGQTPAAETLIASGVRCSIQARREGTQASLLPGDGYKPTWYVFVPKSALTPGILDERDIMTDESGHRYQVVAAYFDSLGHRLSAVSLEA